MSNQIDTSLVQSYRANLELQFQQRGSRLRNFVRNEPLNGEHDFFDRIGPVDAVEKTDRHGDTPLVETPHDRRRIGARDFEWADLIDKPDKLRMLADPTSAYVQNAVFALGRKMDDTIIEAFDATAYTGKNGATTVTAANDGVRTVTAGSGITLDVLRAVKRHLTDRDQTEDGEKLYFGITAEQLDNMLGIDEIQSSDYNAIKALVHGEVDTFMGFHFVRTQRWTKSGNTRKLFAWAKSGMCLAVGDALTVRVSERDDKSYSTQPYVCGTFGATRMWGQQVVQIDATESA